AKPDPRDYMSLPYEARDWAGLLSADVKGKKLGLVLDIGAGLPVQPAIRTVVQKAAEAFEAAGAKVEPVKPFLTPEIHAGLDRFFAARLLADIQLLPPERQAKVLPFISAWCRRAEGLSAVDAIHALGHVMLLREKAVGAIQRYD